MVSSLPSNTLPSGGLAPVVLDAPTALNRPEAEKKPKKPEALSPFAKVDQYFKPPPPKSAFFAEGMKNYFLPSLLKGGDKYFQHIQDSSVKTVAFGASALGMGLLMSMAKDTRKFMHVAFLSTLLVYPVLQAVRNLPLLNRAYQQLTEGNPERADHTLKLAIDNTTYSLFHAFLKPYTAAGLVAALFSIPRIVNHEARGVIETSLRAVLNAVRLKNPVEQRPAEKLFKLPILKQYQQFNDFLCRTGKRFEEPLIKQLSKLHLR